MRFLSSMSLNRPSLLNLKTRLSIKQNTNKTVTTVSIIVDVPILIDLLVKHYFVILTSKLLRIYCSHQLFIIFLSKDRSIEGLKQSTLMLNSLFYALQRVVSAFLFYIFFNFFSKAVVDSTPN